MMDDFYINTQIFILAIYMVISSVVVGVIVSKFKKTKTDRRFIIGGLCGIAASSLLFFGTAYVLTFSDVCCEMEMEDDIGKTFFSLLRFLSTPFALVSTCFFYRGLSEKFNKKYIIETSVLLVLVWMMFIFT